MVAFACRPLLNYRVDRRIRKKRSKRGGNWALLLKFVVIENFRVLDLIYFTLICVSDSEFKSSVNVAKMVRGGLS